MSSTEKLLEIMATLRDADIGCPWDRRQDFASIAPYTVEEAYEVADAIARGDLDGLRDELGDLLFQVVFHAQMARESGDFDFEAVAAGICEKMIRRHPHVFGDDAQRAAGAVKGSWERIKSEERAENGPPGASGSALDGVALALPALKGRKSWENGRHQPVSTGQTQRDLGRRSMRNWRSLILPASSKTGTHWPTSLATCCSALSIWRGT